jgi:hypothetical protein
MEIKKKQDDVAESFLGRVEMDLVHREKNLEALVEEAMEECPFQPVITKRAQRVRFLLYCTLVSELCPFSGIILLYHHTEYLYTVYCMYYRWKKILKHE